MNRNATAKSSASGDGGNPLDDLEGCSPEKLRYLKQHCALMDEQRFPQDEVDRLKLMLLQKAERPIHFRDEAERSNELDLPKLFDQFAAVLRDRPPGGGQGHLTHNFPPRGVDYERLFTWSIFADSLAIFFRPVHREIYVNARSRDYDRGLADRKSVQDALIHSHFNPTALRSLDLVLAVERALTAVLTRVLLHGCQLLLVLEWYEARPFLLVVGFRLCYPQNAKKVAARTLEYLAQQPVTLTREDLVGERQDEEAAPSSEQTHDMTWLRQTVRNSPLQYIYCAYAKRQ